MHNDSIAERRAPPELDYQLPDVIHPRWMAGVPALEPSHFTVDCTQVVDVAAAMQATYNTWGIVRLVNTGQHEIAALRELARLVMDREMTYEGGANPRNAIRPNVFEVGAPLTAWLHYHHEMAYVGQSTRGLAFLCLAATPGKGATYFSDSVAATNAILETELGQQLATKGVCYHRILTDRRRFTAGDEVGIYNHWQQSLGTEDPDEAVAIAESKGLVTEWGEQGELRTRYYADAFEYFAPLDRNLLYCSIADHGMWFDGWPLVMHLPYEARPLHMTFGDDSEFTRADLELFVDVYDQFGIRVDWEVGDLVVFCNHRFAHGRPGVHLLPGERRELGVMLGERFDRVGQR